MVQPGRPRPALAASRPHPGRPRPALAASWPHPGRPRLSIQASSWMLVPPKYARGRYDLFTFNNS